MKTKRLVLRKWTEADAESLYEYAKDPEVGPIAGWPPHKSVEESLDVIRNVFNGPECYAICEKENGKAIGAIELKLKGHTDMTDREDECELGYWLTAILGKRLHAGGRKGNSAPWIRRTWDEYHMVRIL